MTQVDTSTFMARLGHFHLVH